MSATWTFPAFVDLLKTQLEALPAILALDPTPAIRVSLPHAGEDISDIISLGVEASDEDNIKSALGGQSHDEDVRIGCRVAVLRYGSGDVEAKVARDRVVEILTIIDEHLRATSYVIGSSTLRNPQLQSRDFESFPSEVGEKIPVRVARCPFDITYKARTTP